MITLLALGLLTRFLFFGYPNEVVFDEVHFGKFISWYAEGSYFFDIHPPLGKLIIVGFADILGFDPHFSFAEIGNAFPNRDYMLLRFLPSLAGALLPLVIFLFALELGIAPIAAFATGGFVLFDNALNTQSRFILLDSFLLLFGFTGLWLYWRYRNTKRILYFFAAGACGALAASVKWTGATFLALPALVEIFDSVIGRKWPNHFLQKLSGMIVVPALIYVGVFAIHLSMLKYSGSGDAFMTPYFQKSLIGSQYEQDAVYNKLNFFQKFVELNVEMFRSNQRLTATHPYGSAWYTWPLMTRPIYYWNRDHGRIYLLGNPALWWGSTVAILTLLGLVISGELRRDRITLTLLGAWALNLLPFIGISRVMFLYHYLAALIFAFLALAYLINQQKPQVVRRTFIAIGLVALTAFIYFAPLTYGLDLKPGSYENRVWLNSWL